MINSKSKSISKKYLLKHFDLSWKLYLKKNTLINISRSLHRLWNMQNKCWYFCETPKVLFFSSNLKTVGCLVAGSMLFEILVLWIFSKTETKSLSCVQNKSFSIRKTLESIFNCEELLEILGVLVLLSLLLLLCSSS